jgi:hypothetical protein
MTNGWGHPKKSYKKGTKIIRGVWTTDSMYSPPPGVVLKKKVSSRQTRRLWSNADLQTLRKRAGLSAVHVLARVLKRSDSAVRFKAWSTKISLAQDKRKRKIKKKKRKKKK